MFNFTMKSLACGSRMEISLGLGDNIDIVEIKGKKNDKSVSDLVNSVHTHLKTIRETDIISSEL